ncbi:dipeptidase 1 isoform X2 [Folsomia candida]|nr:dipeptidase 1 isoform X2 [Folsomia candida]
MKHWCFVCCVLFLAAIVGVGVGVPLAMMEDFITSPQERLTAAQKILREVPLIDGHNDFPWNLRKFLRNNIQDFNFTADLRKVEPWSRSTWSHTDLLRLQEGMVGCQVFSAYVPCGSQHLDAVQLTLEQIDVIRRLTVKYADALEWVTESHGIETAHRRGKIASMVGVEGGHSIGNSIAVLRMFYNLGARYLTLTHTCNTPWADYAAGIDDPNQKTKTSGLKEVGLKEFGKKVIKEMNRIGMVVDLSHVSVQTMRDSLNVTKAPVIFSHSSAHSICNSTRNVPDDILRELSSNGGLVMVSFYNYFITCNGSASITDVIAHINHIRDVAGVDHVGIGAGFDGINYTPRGLEDVSKYPNLFAKLLEDPKWTTEDLKKLAGNNFLRVLRRVEQVRDQWQIAAVQPVEDSIPAKYIDGHTQCVYVGS